MSAAATGPSQGYRVVKPRSCHRLLHPQGIHYGQLVGQAPPAWAPAPSSSRLPDAQPRSLVVTHARRKWYAVFQPADARGVYRAWDHVKQLVLGHSHAVHKGFASESAALTWIRTLDIRAKEEDAELSHLRQLVLEAAAEAPTATDMSGSVGYRTRQAALLEPVSHSRQGKQQQHSAAQGPEVAVAPRPWETSPIVLPVPSVPSREYYRKWYAVRFVEGGSPGVYNTWQEAEAAINGRYAEHRSFDCQADAVAFAFGPGYVDQLLQPPQLQQTDTSTAGTCPEGVAAFSVQLLQTGPPGDLEYQHPHQHQLPLQDQYQYPDEPLHSGSEDDDAEADGEFLLPLPPQPHSSYLKHALAAGDAAAVPPPPVNPGIGRRPSESRSGSASRSGGGGGGSFSSFSSGRPLPAPTPMTAPLTSDPPGYLTSLLGSSGRSGLMLQHQYYHTTSAWPQASAIAASTTSSYGYSSTGFASPPAAGKEPPQPFSATTTAPCSSPPSYFGSDPSEPLGGTQRLQTVSEAPQRTGDSAPLPESLRRPRGRPRKVMQPEPQMAAVAVAGPSGRAEPVKRQRGRPRKNEMAGVAPAATSLNAAAAYAPAVSPPAELGLAPVPYSFETLSESQRPDPDRQYILAFHARRAPGAESLPPSGASSRSSTTSTTSPSSHPSSPSASMLLEYSALLLDPTDKSMVACTAGVLACEHPHEGPYTALLVCLKEALHLGLRRVQLVGPGLPLHPSPPAATRQRPDHTFWPPSSSSSSPSPPLLLGQPQQWPEVETDGAALELGKDEDEDEEGFYISWSPRDRISLPPSVQPLQAELIRLLDGMETVDVRGESDARKRAAEAAALAGTVQRLAAEWAPQMSPAGLEQLLQVSEAERQRWLAQSDASSSGEGQRSAPGAASAPRLGHGPFGSYAAALLQYLYGETGCTATALSTDARCEQPLRGAFVLNQLHRELHLLRDGQGEQERERERERTTTGAKGLQGGQLDGRPQQGLQRRRRCNGRRGESPDAPSPGRAVAKPRPAKSRSAAAAAAAAAATAASDAVAVPAADSSTLAAAGSSGSSGDRNSSRSGVRGSGEGDWVVALDPEAAATGPVRVRGEPGLRGAWAPRRERQEDLAQAVADQASVVLQDAPRQAGVALVYESAAVSAR